MKRPPLAAFAALALGLATACSGAEAPAPGPGPAVAPSAAPSSAGRPAWSGGYAFTAKDLPYQSVLAEAARSGRPALLFFWTSW